MAGLPGSGPNMYGPVPLSAVGVIQMQTLLEFSPDVDGGKPLIAVSADGNGLIYVQGGAQKMVTQGGVVIPLPSNVTFNTSTMLGSARIFDSKRIEICTTETYPVGFTSGAIVNTDEGPANFAPHFKMYDYYGNLISSQWSIPSGEYIPGFDSWYVPAWFRDPFASDAGTNGDNYWPAVCWKLDDYRQEQGLYYSTSLQGPYNSGVNYHADLSKSSSNSFAYIAGFDQVSFNYFQRGLLWTPNYNPEFQNGAYDGYFAADIVSYALTSTTITLGGINCHCFGYWDNAANQALPPRLAQDIYLAALASMGGANTGTQPWTTVRAMPTRLLNSATYALSIWEPGLAINETMDQYGITTQYPEVQLATVGFFHEQRGVKYYNVIPQDFLRLDIPYSPDLVWVSPNGHVLGVWHSASGQYYLMVGGTLNATHTAVSNYRLPVTLGG